MEALPSAPQWMDVPERAVGGDRECASRSVSVVLSSAVTTRTSRASAGTECVFLARLRLPTAARQSRFATPARGVLAEPRPTFVAALANDGGFHSRFPNLRSGTRNGIHSGGPCRDVVRRYPPTPRANAGTECVFLARLRLPTRYVMPVPGARERGCGGQRWVGALSVFRRRAGEVLAPRATIGSKRFRSEPSGLRRPLAHGHERRRMLFPNPGAQLRDGEWNPVAWPWWCRRLAANTRNGHGGDAPVAWVGTGGRGCADAA